MFSNPRSVYKYQQTLTVWFMRRGCEITKDIFKAFHNCSNKCEPLNECYCRWHYIVKFMYSLSHNTGDAITYEILAVCALYCRWLPFSKTFARWRTKL